MSEALPERTVRFGPDAFVLYGGGVRRSALELYTAICSFGVRASVEPGALVIAQGEVAPCNAAGRGRFQFGELRRALTGRGEIRHACYYDPAFTLLGPDVVTVHDMIHEMYGLGRGLPLLKSAAVRRSKHIVTPSEFTARQVLERHPSAAITVIPHGLSQRFHDAPHDRYEPGWPYVMYVGPRAGYKNFDLLVRAWRLLPAGLGLLLVGGEPLGDAERSNMSGRLGGAPVHHLRPGDSDLIRCYDGASVVVLTSRCEGFGLPAAEALVRGTPVAASSGGSLPEVVGGHGQIFDPDDPEDCARAISSALESTDAQRDAAKRWARRFTWDESARQHARLYASLG